MIRVFRTSGLAALVLCLAFSSVGMAAARGMAPPAGFMVLCTGHGVVTVWIDDAGHPVEAVHLCPDCALSLFAAVAPIEASLGAGASWRRVLWRDTSQVLSARSSHPAQARGPPAWP